MQSLPFLLLLGAAALSKSGGRCRAFSLAPVSFTAGRRTAGRPAAATPAPMAAGSDCDDGAATKVVVVGGGIAGLSTAHYLATDPGDKFAGRTFDVTVLDLEPPVRDRSQTSLSSLANLGISGPQYTKWWEDTPFFRTLTESIENYEEWANSVEDGAKTASDDIKNKYLPIEEGEKPWEVGYTENELLAKPLKGDSEDDWVTREAIEGDPPQEEGPDRFNSRTLVRVDARRLIMSLRTACENAGVNMLLGSDYEVESLILDGSGEGEGQECHGVTCTGGDEYRGKVVVANGAQLNKLLKDVNDTPENPAKSIETSVIVYRNEDNIVKGPMFRRNIYICPTVDGKVLVFSNLDSKDINTIKRDLESFAPKVANLLVDMELALVRCETGDRQPILGGISYCTNLYLAGAFSAYGMTLAPKSAQVLGDAIADVGLSDQDKELLEAFSLSRSTIDDEPNQGQFIPFP